MRSKATVNSWIFSSGRWEFLLDWKGREGAVRRSGPLLGVIIEAADLQTTPGRGQRAIASILPITFECLARTYTIYFLSFATNSQIRFLIQRLYAIYTYECIFLWWFQFNVFHLMNTIIIYLQLHKFCRNCMEGGELVFSKFLLHTATWAAASLAIGTLPRDHIHKEYKA